MTPQLAQPVDAGQPGRLEFEDLVRRHQGMVFSIAFHFIQDRSAAEELAQDVFLQFHRHLPSLESDQHVTFWLRRVAAHRCIDYARRRKHSFLGLEAAPEPQARENSSDPLLSRRMRRLIASLSHKPRKHAGEQQAKNVVSKLKSIHVRSFEFAKEGEYSEADVAAFRSQLRSPAWSRILEAKDGREHMEVFVKQDGNRAAGLVMISAEPKELTIVNIDGSIDLKELASLGGQFGIPNIDASASKPAPAVVSRTRSAEKDSAE